MEEDSDVGVTVMEIYNEKIKDLLLEVITGTSDKGETWQCVHMKARMAQCDMKWWLTEREAWK